RSSRRRGRFGTVSEAVDGRHERELGREPDDVPIARLDLSRFRPLGRAPFDHRSPTRPVPRLRYGAHFFIVTVVPLPTSETMSNSSTSRRAPGSPRPRPLPVV